MIISYSYQSLPGAMISSSLRATTRRLNALMLGISPHAYTCIYDIEKGL